MNAALHARPRDERGKSAARAMRRAGRTPAVVYGHTTANQELSVDTLELDHLLSSISIDNTLIDLTIQGGPTAKVLIRELQRHPFRPFVYHVDFYEVTAGEKLQVNVPIHLVGVPVGVREEGGVLQQPRHEVEVECLPNNIPEEIQVDVSGLDIGDHITIGSLRIPDAEILDDPEVTICSVVPPTIVKEPEEEVEAVEGVLEPELVGEEGEEAEPGEAAETEGEGEG
ncbi:50S ribosomal protein L25/general stress protein Ctc [soil metagenome]|jgi:large subunit ribosomal protein L25